MKFRFLTLAALAAMAASAPAEVVLQYFGTTWNEIERRLPELAERGYDALWLPPPFKAGAGTFSVGFDTLDRFDLGDRDQSGTVRTKYGTKADLLRLMRAAHRFGFRVYFDNVMAHNAGPLGKTTNPGQLFPNVPGFVPEDFHLVREPDGTWRKAADWPNWNDEWQVLNRNPFAWDIAQESPNTSFNPSGTAEGFTYPKWTGIRHPGQHQWYPDTDLVVATNQAGEPVHPFANKEPFQDVGYPPANTGANNGKFDWNDLNTNGQHDVGEPSEPFTDTGVDPSVPWRQTTQWGHGDGIYNMGNIVPEDVNQMLFRAIRWFIDEARPDGFRLDAVKHVPAYFFGKQTGADRDWVNWGYNGQIQEQFNISRGFSDWNNHRDSLFGALFQARDDAMLFGEHLGSPPSETPYLEAGMRVANDNLLNTVRNTIGSSLAGYDATNHGAWGNAGQSVAYVMSHDNAWLWGGDRPLAHAYIAAREGLPIIYTDGYNQAGAPDFFPKPSGVNFLGQFGDNSVISAIAVHRDFSRGGQTPRFSDQNYAAFERVDNRENKLGGSWNGSVMVFMMARGYQPNGQGRLFATGFPVGATLWNYSPHGGRFPVFVNNSAQIVNFPGGTNPPLVPPGGWFAFGWHTPNLPALWQAARHEQQVAPITIEQNGQPVGMMDHWRVDGRDGDPAYNPYGVPAGDTATRAYRVKIPRVTDGTNLRFVARADATAGNILMRLNGGVDLNSQMGFGPTTGAKRDFAPGLNSDQADASNPSDTVLQASTDTYLGYEQMRFVRRTAEKFAARPPAVIGESRRNVIGSAGAETYQAVIGTAGFTINNGNGPNATGSGITPWLEHAPAIAREGSTELQMNPAPQSAANQSVDLWVRVGYQFQADRIWVYYTTDGSTFPEGHDGVGKGTTRVVQANWVYNGASDGTAIPDWYRATLPAMPPGTVLRYKIGAVGPGNLPPRFPFSEDDVKFAERAETVFEVSGFNAETVAYHVHNDYGKMATGLEEGYHVLNTRAFVNRTDGASIFRTQTQVFYYDSERPAGDIAFPAQNDQLGGSSYGVVVRTDPSVTAVQYYIDDLSPGNDNPAYGNGLHAWADATPVPVPTNLGGTAFTKEWRFDYVNIPSSGIANIVVRLKEASSSADNSLADTAGHFTTLVRQVNTGSSINFNIGFPSFPGETVDENYVMKVYFNKSLVPPGMTDQQFLDEFSILISSTVSGSPENPVPQPRSGYVLRRDATPTEHSVEFTLPNLFNGDPDFLHTIRAEHRRGTLTLGDSELVKMRENASLDTDNDTLPDWWEILHGLDRNNPAGRNGPGGDEDDDGQNNRQEYILGMNPNLSDPHLVPVLRIDVNPNGTIAITHPALANRRHRVTWSPGLTGWQPMQSGWWIPSSGQTQRTVTDDGTFTGTHPSETDRRFYRLEVDLP